MLPKNFPISKLVTVKRHKRTGHAGRGMTLSKIGTYTFWKSGIRKFLYYCFACRRFRRKHKEEKMAKLSFDRLQEETRFTYCQVDLFSPLTIWRKCKELKRSEVVCTFLFSRAIHIVVVYLLDAYYFLLALQNLIGKRGNNWEISSDNKSNFLGAVSELQNSFQDMNQGKVLADV